MGSIFQGTPQTATSYTKSSTETPQWLQDAIYNQVQWAQNIANTPYQSYDLPTVAELSPLQQQAYQAVQGAQGAWAPAASAASSGMQGYADLGTAGQLGQTQAQYLQPELAGQATVQGLTERAMQAASPYLQSSAQTAASQVGQYMSPYQQGVMDVIAKQGARNLTENLLPGVSDAFIKAGQFGSSRMGEMGSRALRDTQEAILNQQAQAAQAGYGQALSAAQTDLARQGQLAGTVGSISGSDISRILSGGQAQQQFGLSAAQAEQAAQAQDYARQMGALQNVANMAQQAQGMTYTDTAALEAAGAAQQAQQQRQLDAAKAQFEAQRLYPQQQMDWLSTQIRGLAPITPQTTTQTGSTTGATYSPSPLSQLATGLYTYKGLTSV